MWNSSKQKAPGQAPASTPTTTKQRGDAAEDWALCHLQAHGLRLVRRNFKTPGRGGGEVDLIMREPDGTLVFVEVRQRASIRQGGAIASIGPVKQRRIVWAARHFLLRCQPTPPCRFDAVLVQGQVGQPDCDVQWIRAAFDAGGA
jgi:putative endonuclease